MALALACSCAKNTNSDEGKPAPVKGADGIQTNQIVFKKSVRRAYGKSLELAKTEVDISAEQEAEAGVSPENAVPSDIAVSSEKHKSSGGERRYLNELRSAQARRERAARAEAEDSLWILPRSPMMDLGLSESSSTDDAVRPIDSPNWGWMAEGMVRLAENRRAQSEGKEELTEEAMADAMMETIAMERSARMQQAESDAAARRSSSVRSDELQPYGANTEAGIASGVPMWIAATPANPFLGEADENSTVQPWLATPARDDTSKDEEEDTSQEASLARYYDPNASQTGNGINGESMNSMNSMETWGSAGWGGSATTPFSGTGSPATSDYGWPMPASTARKNGSSRISGAGPAYSSWNSAPFSGASAPSGPAPFQPSIQPIFTPKRPSAPSASPSGLTLDGTRPSAPNYLDPTAPRR